MTIVKIENIVLHLIQNIDRASNNPLINHLQNEKRQSIFGENFFTGNSVLELFM